MQEVQLYIGNKKTLSGTVTYSTSNNISDNTKNFYQNDWVVGATIKNVQTGVTATILSIYSQVTITLDISASSFGSGLYEIEKTEYQRLDTYKDETVTITQSIKNIKDLAKILTDFSQSFTIPASKNNNKIFKHYYNSDIQNSIDARFLIDAKINLNGIDFKEGKIRVLGVKMKDNSPSSYQITFVGNTVSLKTLFSDDELTDLPYLDVFNHDYSYNNILQYMQTGYNFSGSSNSSAIYPDMMYPFISAESRYYYDSGQQGTHPEIENVRNIYNHDPQPVNSHSDYHSLSMYDFKPAIKVYYILKAIEEKYGFTFSTDFFGYQSNEYIGSEVFEKLYLWCSRKAGSLVDNIDEEYGEVKFEDLTLSTGTEVREDSNTSFTIFRSSPSGGRFTYINLTYQGTVDVTGTGFYDVLIYDKDTNEVYAEFKNETGDKTFTQNFIANSNETKVIKPTVKVTTKAGITSFSLSNVVLTKESKLSLQDPATITTGNYSSSSVTVSAGLKFRQNFLPKIKVIDFLTGIFKMFNLVAYFEGTELVVKTLDDYYLNSSNAEFDITKYVDMGSSTINRNDVYSEINYEYEKPKTIFAIKSNEATNDEFGNERFKSEGDNAFDGGKYDIKVKFGHMLYEDLIDLNTGNFSNIYWGYSVDKDENPALEAATLFLSHRPTLPSDIYFTDKPFGLTGNGYSINEMTYLQVPSNFYAVSTTPYSINFGSEYAVYRSVIDNSLFKIYHQNFIQNIYDPQARILKISAHLPLSVLLKYKLNDRFIVGGKKYLINSAKTNLQTGKTELELLTDNYIEA